MSFENDLWNVLLVVVSAVAIVVVVAALEVLFATTYLGLLSIYFVYVCDAWRPFHINFIKCLLFHYYILYSLDKCLGSH